LCIWQVGGWQLICCHFAADETWQSKATGIFSASFCLFVFFVRFSFGTRLHFDLWLRNVGSFFGLRPQNSRLATRLELWVARQLAKTKRNDTEVKNERVCRLWNFNFTLNVIYLKICLKINKKNAAYKWIF